MGTAPCLPVCAQDEPSLTKIRDLEMESNGR
jgi:hypothetical protein